jgi:hypothetical protein
VPFRHFHVARQVRRSAFQLDAPVLDQPTPAKVRDGDKPAR